MRVVLCAAGSGGHIYPALRCAAELRQRNPRHDIRILSTRRAVEEAIFKDVPYPRIVIDMPQAPSRRAQSGVIFCLKIPVFLLQWVTGCVRVARILHAVKPELVVGFGGLSSATAVLMARLRGIPTLIHEQNVTPGRANRLTGLAATRIAVAYAATQRFFPQGKTRLVGNPIRPNFSVQTPVHARRRMGLKEACFTIAVTGGSQGAQYLNERVPAALARLAAERRDRIQVLHVAGLHGSGGVRHAYTTAHIAAQVFDYRRDMDSVYCAADVVICRAGAMTLTELQHVGAAAILVPYPHAGSHQRANARLLCDEHAAWSIEQGTDFDRQCSSAVERLMDDAGVRHSLSAKSRALRQEHAAAALADLMEQLSNG